MQGVGVKVLVVGGCRSGLCGRRPGVALCQTQLVPASSKTNPPQDTAEPIHHMCGTPVKMYLRAKNTPGREEGEQKVRNRGNAKANGGGGVQISL